MTLTRRAFLAAGPAVFVGGSGAAQPARTVAAERALAALDARSGGRLGVAILDTRSRQSAGHRTSERFAMCSTFKLPLAALVLREADAGRLALDESVPISKADLVAYAPVVERHVGRTMTLVAMAEATQTTSDNAAANLLLRRLGGPSAFTAMLRALGDDETRLDRVEPALNFVPVGEVRDTTTPLAMARTGARLVTGDGLSAASRERLAGWLVATRTGDKRIRAGLPKDWRAGDKTGTAQADGMGDKVNDIAVLWPPGRPPVVVTAFFDSARTSTATRDDDQALLAEVGRIAATWVLTR
jgi:beta-lactamase class A